MKCQICGREATGEFCELHESAYKNLQVTYVGWEKALSITWSEYLKEVLKNPNTGIWAKEVAQRILTESSRE